MTQLEVEVNEQGRVTIPAQIRRELHIEPGTHLIAVVEDGRLVLQKPADVLARYQALVAAAAKAAGVPADARVSDSLISDRRDEAAVEAKSKW